jgi:hypothetical protein
MREMRNAPARFSRGLDPISAMSWGRKPVRRGQQGRTSIRMAGVYADPPGIASNKKTGMAHRKGRRVQSQRRGSAQPADLFLGHHPLDVLSLAFDAVTRASVRLDGQACDDGIDASLPGDGAALRPLKLVVDIVIDRVIVRHRAIFPLKQGF